MKKFAWFKHPNDLSNDKGYPHSLTMKEEEDTERICTSSKPFTSNRTENSLSSN